MLATALALTLAAEPSLSTIAEQSKWTRTGRYEEAVRLCGAFATAYPDRVKCETFGTTPEGRPMVALVAGSAPNRPAILIQGGIHAGEIDGKDAGFWALREVLEGKAAPGVLDKVSVVFVPVFNIDGHERFGPNHRPNQRGPEEMGWRTTAHNLNLNRDYTKADAPEMAAMHRLIRDRDPILLADLHVTDGAEFEHSIAVLVDPVEVGPPSLRDAGRKLREALLKKLEAKGHLPLPFYPSFNKEDDPSSGFGVGVAPPRYGTAYFAAINRIGMLVETHSWKDYPTRVRATHDTVIGLLELAAKDAAEWVRAAKTADDQAQALGGAEVTLGWDNTEHSRMIDFKGYAYTRTLSAISGQLKVSYDPRRPQIWRVPYYDQLKPVVTARAPKGGYLVPAAHAAWLGAKLRDHGITLSVVSAAQAGLEVEVFRASDVKFAPQPFEGRTVATIQGGWVKEKRDLAAGALSIPIGQRKSRLVVHLFEPAGPDSFARWGFFNGCFEQKEYLEPYVTEQVAEQMLAKDPAIRAEFEKKLQTEPAFQQSAAQRLDFFYRRHPSFDREFFALPIYRRDAAP